VSNKVRNVVVIVVYLTWKPHIKWVILHGVLSNITLKTVGIGKIWKRGMKFKNG